MVQFLCPSVQFRFPFFVELRGVAFQTFHDLFRKRTGCQCSNVSFTHLIGCGNMEREHTDAHIELKNETKKMGEHTRTTKQPQNQTTKQRNNQTTKQPNNQTISKSIRRRKTTFKIANIQNGKTNHT